MEKYVSQEECELRRTEVMRELDNHSVNISKIFGELKATNENVKRIIDVVKIFFTGISSILGGLLIWLITQ